MNKGALGAKNHAVLHQRKGIEMGLVQRLPLGCLLPAEAQGYHAVKEWIHANP